MVLLNVLGICLNQYKNDLLAVIGYNDVDSKEVVDKLNEAIEKDLSGKGFNNNEISQLQISMVHKDTAYKFIAYFILLSNDFSDVDSLKQVINNDLDHLFTIDDFEPEELDLIAKYRSKIDY